jgi:hypothetical protein
MAFALCLCACAMEQISFDKDPYNARIQLAADPEAYSLDIAFSPVKLFSKVKNEQINLNKAKIYALTALSRKLKVDKDSVLIIANMKTENCRTAEDRFSCSLVIPVKDVHIVARVNAPDGSCSPDDLLLNYKAAMKRIFVESWKEWKSKIGQTPLDQEAADNLSRIEDEINSELDKECLQKKFESDVMLFEDDVRELQNLAEKMKKDLLIRCEIRLMEFNLKSDAVRDKAKYHNDINAKERQTIDAEKI